MPANLSPEYKNAEAAYKKASDPRERLDLLRTMLRTVPKHKGTDHLQADIKSRIKELTEELAGPKKGGAKSGPPTSFRPEGAAQIALVGPPNSGKSSLHARLTGSHATVGEYPFTTQFPQPGMMPYDDVAFQLIDLPPISPEHPIPWIGNALQAAHGCLLIVDLCEVGCMEHALEVRDVLAERKIVLSPVWPGNVASGTPPSDDGDPFTIRIPTLLVVNKADRVDDPQAEMAIFEDLTDMHYPAIAVSAETGEGVDRLGAFLFSSLEVIRVYTKTPGKPADMERPYTLRSSGTVHDVADMIHHDLAESLAFARLWREGSYDGAHVGADLALADGDVLELHT